MKTAAAVDLIIALLSRAHEISMLLAAARAEGREELNDSEMASIVATNDLARSELVAAIEKKEDSSGGVG
jgi:hypothetical protein